VVLAVLPAMVGFGRISGPTVAGMAAVAAVAGGMKVRRDGRGPGGPLVAATSALVRRGADRLGATL